MKNTMKTYKIGVVWQMYGYVEVEANSLEEAVKEVEDGGGIKDVLLFGNGYSMNPQLEILYKGVQL